METMNNYLVECVKIKNGRISCTPDSDVIKESNVFNKTLNFDLKYDYQQHAGKIMSMNYTCENGEKASVNFSLIPCRKYTTYLIYNVESTQFVLIYNVVSTNRSDLQCRKLVHNSFLSTIP
jgi:hypothetical protein